MILAFSKIPTRLLKVFPDVNKTTLRGLTQADIPSGLAKGSKSSRYAEPREPTFAEPAVSDGETKSDGPNTRMTSAGILLPRDSATKNPLKVEKDEWKRSQKTDSPQAKRKEIDHGLEDQKENGTMKAWQISRFADIAGLTKVTNYKIPSLNDPFDMLVKIHAASVNPFDVARTRGYGENIIEKMRDASKLFGMPHLPDVTNLFTRKEQPFPITLGRDFSGVVVDTGKAVRSVRAGDEVFGVIGPHRQGTFSEYALTSTWCVAKTPKTISHTEAASIPYAACTAWSAVKLVANLPNRNEHTRVLVLGSSGGVGSFAVQYLKTLDVHVTAICGTSGLDLMADLGADDVIDYKTTDVESELSQREKYDVIFQASGNEYDYTKKFLKGNLKSFFITLTYPLLKNSDDHGGFAGLLKSGLDFSRDYFQSLSMGNHTIWAFFMPNGPFLEEVSGLIDQGRIRPIVGRTFSFKDLPQAFKLVDSGETTGKVVVNILE